MKKFFVFGLWVGLIGGCSTGTLVSKEGTTEDPKWHNTDKVILNKDHGTFPNLQSLNQLRAGMTKDQLYELIGRPQYNDGWRPREWNYLFHFTTPGQGENDISTCQFKVLFDRNMFVSSFYWNPTHPNEAICPPQLNKPRSESQKNVVTKRYSLEADALFSFDKSDIQNINSKGRDDLEHLVAELSHFKKINSVRILGFTDRLGNSDYNLKLSQERADTIKIYLSNNGVNTQLINALGKGSENPIKECENNISRDKLIDCLAPNRRIVVEADGYIEEKE